MREKSKDYERERLLDELKRGNASVKHLNLLDTFYEVSERLDDNLFAVGVGIRHFIYKSSNTKRVDNYRIIEDLRNLNLEKYEEYLYKLADMDKVEIRKFLWIANLDLSGLLGELKMLDTNIDNLDALNIRNKKQLAGNLKQISIYTSGIAKKISEKERVARAS